MKGRIVRLVFFTVASAGLLVLDALGFPLLPLSEGRSVVAFFGIVAAIFAGYQLLVIATDVSVRKRSGAPSEVKMLSSLFKAAVVIAILIVFLQYVGRLEGSWAAFAGFAGLLMGWSLQAPVSGVAAWVFVNMKRLFRVGDRVMLPAWGLTGDVTNIGMMYTVLNQVGGTVGSEEAAGRYVLIPNAMLFSNIVINYTPQQASAYVLDEVVVRITFNSSWELAERILIGAASEVTGDIIKATGEKPYIRADMYDYGVYIRLRFMTLAMDRPRIVYEITKRIYDEFQKHAEVDFAIPYVFSHRAGMSASAQSVTPYRKAETATHTVDIGRIHDPSGVGDDPRNAASVRELAAEIAKSGLDQPIVLQTREDGEYDVVIGHLPLAACKLAGIKTIPAIVRARQ